MSVWVVREDACGTCVNRTSIALCHRFGKSKYAKCCNYRLMSFTVTASTKIPNVKEGRS